MRAGRLYPLDGSAIRIYLANVRTTLAKLLLLIAVLLMPLGMNPAAATAGGHAAQMTHCDHQLPKPHHKAGFSECTMACSAALPAIGRASENLPEVAAAPMHSAFKAVLHGLHPETATPPPRES